MAQVDRSRLDGPGLVAVMQARVRLVSHLQAELLADMVAVTDLWRGPDTPALFAEDAFESGMLEIAAGFRYTRRVAEGWLWLAEEAVRRLPAGHAALAAGSIDLPRARVLCNELTSAADEVARQVVDQVLPDAGQLGARIRKLLAAAQPEQASTRMRTGSATAE